MRRGAPSANAAYGNSTAILVGDLLFGTASDIVADLGPQAVKIQAQTFVRLCSGQIRDDRPCPPGTDPVDYYLGVLADKTGVLIATAARYGAMFAGCDDATVETMREFGERLGVAFQLADDLIDIESEADETGKTPGTDLREGKRTLPVIHVLASTDPADARLRELLTGDLEDDARLAEALRPAARAPGDGRWPASTRTPWRARRRTCSPRCPTATPRTPCTRWRPASSPGSADASHRVPRSTVLTGRRRDADGRGVRPRHGCIRDPSASPAWLRGPTAGDRCLVDGGTRARCRGDLRASRTFGIDRVIATEAKHSAAATTQAQW